MSVITLIIVGLFWRFFTVTNNVAGDFSYLSKLELLQRFFLPQIWQERISEGMGQYALPILWNWPLDFLYGLLGKLGLPFSVIEILLFLIPFIMGGYYSINRFLKYFGVNGSSRNVGTLFYLLNSYVLLLIDGGQFSIALSYIFLPLTYILFLEATEGNNRKKIVAAFGFMVLGFLDIRYIYILAILLICHFVYFEIIIKRSKIINVFSNWLLTSLFVLITFVLFNFYWILPTIVSRAPTLPEGYSNSSQLLDLSFTDWKHAVLMQSPNWFENIFGKISPVNREFLIIPLIVIAGFMLRRKNKYTYYFAALALLGIILVIGTNSPIPAIYTYLFTKVPGFSLFRDSTKFFILISLSYTFLVSKFAESFEGKYSIKLPKKRIYPVSVLIILYILFICRPVWLGKMTGTFSIPLYESGYKATWSELEQDNEFGRVLWLPSQPPLGYSSPVHPAIDALRLVNKRPFASGVVGNYELFNFLREAPYMGEIFDVFGIRYIVYPYYDTRKQEVKKDNDDYYYAFLDQLSNLPWIESAEVKDNVALLKVKHSQDRFFITKNSFLVVGTEQLYKMLSEANKPDLNNNAVLFAEEKPGIAENILKHTDAKILLFEKSKFDSIMSMVPIDNFIFPAGLLDYSPNQTGWWKRNTADFLWLRNFLQNKYGVDSMDFDYGGGLAISEGNNSLQISNPYIEGGKQLLARIMVSKAGGFIKFSQNGKQIGEDSMTKDEAFNESKIKLTGYGEIPDQEFVYGKGSFAWVQVGKLTSSDEITIETTGNLNIVNALVVITDDELKSLSKLVTTDRIIDLQKISPNEISELFIPRSDENTSINYERVSPTHYKIKVNGLTKPSTLVFSESYDSLWQLTNLETKEKQKPYPTYSLMNGFYLRSNGDYDLYFQPQKYVNIGFVVTILTTIGISVYLFLKREVNQV